MPHIIHLSDDQRILFEIMTDPLSMEEIMAGFPVMRRYFDNAPHKLYSIVDALEFRAIPHNILKARISPILMHPNSAEIAVVATGLAAMLAETMFRIINYRKARLFDNREEALVYLRDIIEVEKVR